MKTPAIDTKPEWPDLGPLFAPRAIAVIGATEETTRAGGRALGILKMVGYGGQIFPVHPEREVVQGLRAYPAIGAVAPAADLAIIALGPERVPAALRDCAAAGVRAAAVFADGFDARLRRELKQALAEARARSGLRLLGPNTIGFRALATSTYGTFAGDIELGTDIGPTAFIAQSGGMSTYFGSTCLRRRGVGTRYLIDTGNEVDICAADCIRHIAADAEVAAIGLMLEGARDGRKLAAAISYAVAKGKTIVTMKMARSSAGLAQAASHTGALAGRGELFDAELRTAGACVVEDEAQMLDAIAIAAHRRIPRGRGVGVVTSSGGFGILALDAAERSGMEVPAPSLAPTAVQQAAVRGGKFANPFDFSSSLAAGPRAADTALEWIVAQPNVDAIVAFHFYSAFKADRQERLFAQLSAAARSTLKPVFVCGVAPPEFEARMRAEGVLWFEDPSSLMRALSALTPRVEKEAPAPPAGARAQGTTITGARARALLQPLEHLPQVETFEVRDAASARELALRLGGKFMVKVESDAHAHKSDLGLVAGPIDATEVGFAFERLQEARTACGAGDAPIVLQRFERGCELALGAYVDPIFGPSVMVATGGIFLEILHDAAFAAAPVTPARARELILGLRGAPLLLGARGRAMADVDAAAAALADLSQFIYRHAREFAEVDINPLIVRDQGKGVVAVDALLVQNEPPASEAGD